jgi:ATP-dependent Clp protease ATP-binding subunit ClpA
MQAKKNNKPHNIIELEHTLKNRIFGQDHVVKEVLDTLTVSMAGLGNENKPKASFLFTGPTGVGKTELAKEIANLLDLDFVRLDMSEYADEYSARNLTGGQKGLVGYDDGGILTNEIHKKPYSVLLLDEVEKAHKKVYDTFLQVLDYGMLTDTQGKKVDFTKTIIIMTSNLGTSEKDSIGFGKDKNANKEQAVVDFLSPEFRNRLDKILDFNPLTQDIIMSITKKFLKEFSKKLRCKNIKLKVSTKAKQQLCDIGFDIHMGARSISRAIDSELKQFISKSILLGEIKDGGIVEIDAKEERFCFNYIEPEAPKKSKQGYFDFETAEESLEYAKHNVGKTVTRAPSGYGYIIKD